LEDPDFYFFILMKIPKNSILKDIINTYQSGDRVFEYIEAHRNPINNQNESTNIDSGINFYIKIKIRDNKKI